MQSRLDALPKTRKGINEWNRLYKKQTTVAEEHDRLVNKYTSPPNRWITAAAREGASLNMTSVGQMIGGFLLGDKALLLGGASQRALDAIEQNTRKKEIPLTQADLQ